MFKGNRVSVWDNEKVLEMDGEDSCTFKHTYHHWTVHLRMVRAVNFALCVLYYDKIILE